MNSSENVKFTVSNITYGAHRQLPLDLNHWLRHTFQLITEATTKATTTTMTTMMMTMMMM